LQHRANHIKDDTTLILKLAEHSSTLMSGGFTFQQDDTPAHTVCMRAHHTSKEAK